MITLSSIVDQFQYITDTGKHFIWLTGGVCGALIIVHVINVMMGRVLNVLGILPRHILGLPGIVFSPLLHQDSTHLVFNLIPLFLLSNLVLLLGLKAYLIITVILVISSGLLTWLFGRRAIHIGASSVVVAYWSFMLVYSFTSFSIVSIMTAVICVYYFGSLIFSIVPTEEGVSWEGHLFGFISGLGLGYVWFIEESGPLKIALVSIVNHV